MSEKCNELQAYVESDTSKKTPEQTQEVQKTPEELVKKAQEEAEKKAKNTQLEEAEKTQELSSAASSLSDNPDLVAEKDPACIKNPVLEAYDATPPQEEQKTESPVDIWNSFSDFIGMKK